jgi:hypothetical protein
MQLAPDIQEIKCLLRDIISHGDQVTIANLLGVKSTDVSHRFNPDQDRKPALVEGLREGWAISIVNPEAGRKLKAYVNALFDSWLEPVKATDKNLSTLVNEALKETTELVIARSEAVPVHDQLDRALAVQQVIDQIIVGLQSQFELRAESDVKRFPKRAGA